MYSWTAMNLQILYASASFMTNVKGQCMLSTGIFIVDVSYFLFSRDCRVSFADPVAVRHSLEILSELASMDPYAVSMALGN